ncbi:MAG TPA: FAD-dependent oxidoreductase [Solirubrobacterales bacterium]|nr:FAD-dependent oxidoreductase [Solirubrobacterales bacterium]
MREVDFLLVGGGMASAYCASELRRQGADGSVLLVGREKDLPYERPPLSKEYLRGDAERADAVVNGADWYADNDIELLCGKSVMSLDAGERVAKIQGGEEVRFEKALLATGAMVNILRVDGAELEGIHYLRAFGNSDAIREETQQAKRAVLIGGSYIGCEVAASLVEMGVECTVVMQEEVALSRSFGEEAGRFFQDVLESKGVEFVGGTDLGSFGGEGRVGRVVTEDGRELECDFCVVGAGVRPDAMLAQRCGLEVDDGIVCDSRLESSVEGIFAGGDCCSYDSVVHGRRLRVEHWDVALQQGRHVGKAMLGSDEPYKAIPYFFSDLSDWTGLEYVGPAKNWDEIVFRGTPDDGEFSAWYLKDGRVGGALAVGRSEDLIHARMLIETGADVSEQKAELEDPDSELASVGL